MSSETSATIVPVILSGGSGTRLWPFSREQLPKQFLPLVGQHTLLQETLQRVLRLRGDVREPIVVCNEEHRFLVAEQARALGIELSAIVLEPQGRNTAPAVAAAALLAAEAAGASTDSLLLILPSDHVVRDAEAFARAVSTASSAAEEGYLVTFGVVPDKPETGYGYLLRGEARGEWSKLEKFVEKPDLATAASYVESGNYLWNSGMFLFGAHAYIRELELHEPTMVAACRESVRTATREGVFVRLGRAFVDCPANSIDYAVMEKSPNAAVVPLDAGWSDVGSWSALHEVLEKDSSGNFAVGDVLLEGCNSSYVAATSRLVAAIGLSGVIVVETDNAVLVMSSDRAQDLKKLVDELEPRASEKLRDPGLPHESE